MKTLLKTPKKGALDLFQPILAKGATLESLHEYTDNIGNPIYWRARLKNYKTKQKYIRPMTLIDGEYMMCEPQWEGKKGLYRLDRISSCSSEEVILICEGEWCVEHLEKLGILATTSGAANSVNKADWAPLAERKVILWPDNDKAGRKYTYEVIEQLKKLEGVTIRVIDVDLLNIPDKGDAVDWLANHPSPTKQDIFDLPTIDGGSFIEKCGMEGINSTLDKIRKNMQEKPTQIACLVSFAQCYVELFHDPNGEGYGKFFRSGEVNQLNSRTFREWLSASYYDSTSQAVRDQAIREAVSILSGLARSKGETHEVYIRVAKQEDAYYLDLGEPKRNRAVCISATEWKIIDNPPVRFIRPDSMQPLPEPIAGGDLSVLWDLVNIPPKLELLVLTWLAECLRPETPFPLLELIGEQGSAKSTTQKILRSLIDPNTCDLRSAAKTVDDIFVSAHLNWINSYENISYLAPSVQDALCILSTGGGHAKRKLYSDMDEAIITVKRPIILNGISIAVTAQDLVDRTLSIETPRIEKRTEHNYLLTKYKDNHAQILGGILDIMVKALSHLPQMPQLPHEESRLIEFLYLGMAVSEVTKNDFTIFLSQFKHCRQEAIARTLDASPVATVLMDWIEQGNQFLQKEPLNQLFQKLSDYRSFSRFPNEGWPKSAKGFGDALRRAAPALRQMGVECRSLGKIGSYVHWQIAKIQPALVNEKE